MNWAQGRMNEAQDSMNWDKRQYELGNECRMKNERDTRQYELGTRQDKWDTRQYELRHKAG